MPDDKKRKREKAPKRKNVAGPLQKRARRDVRLAIDPVLDEIRRQQQSADRDYGQNAERVSDIYAALQKELGPLAGNYDTAAQGIASDLQGQLGGLAGLLAPSMAAYEGLAPSDAAAQSAQLLGGTQGSAQAQTDLLGSLGAGGLQLLANDRSRNLGYQTSVQRQGVLQKGVDEKRLLQDFRDTIEDLKGQRFDVMQDVPSQIIARLDQLRQTRKENKLAQSELELRQEIANKQLHEQRRQFNSGNRQDRRLQDVVVGQLTDAEKRENVRQDLKQVNKSIDRVTQRIHGIKADEPYNPNTGPHGSLEPNPQIQSLRRRRKGLKQQRSKYRKRKRTL